MGVVCLGRAVDAKRRRQDFVTLGVGFEVPDEFAGVGVPPQNDLVRQITIQLPPRERSIPCHERS